MIKKNNKIIILFLIFLSEKNKKKLNIFKLYSKNEIKFNNNYIFFTFKNFLNSNYKILNKNHNFNIIFLNTIKMYSLNFFKNNFSNKLVFCKKLYKLKKTKFMFNLNFSGCNIFNKLFLFNKKITFNNFYYKFIYKKKYNYMFFTNLIKKHKIVIKQNDINIKNIINLDNNNNNHKNYDCLEKILLYKPKQKKSIFLFISLNLNFNLFFINTQNFNFLFKSNNLNNINFFKNLVHINDFYRYNFFVDKKIDFFSNKYLINLFNIFELNEFNLNNKMNIKQNFKLFNNYYPIIAYNKTAVNSFFNNLKINKNLNYLYLTNRIFLNFFEFLFKKKIMFKISNNKYYKLKNYYLNNLLNEYKNYNPSYFKNFFFLDFLQILWYSFLLKDLKIISEWISKFMETLNFKNHKKFINFFNNFLNKYSGLFIDVLGVKGFFFDIRGKVGVTGSSKKRHISFKFGSLSKSSKDLKINFNQNLVRTYSGVLGLTYIIAY